MDPEWGSLPDRPSLLAVDRATKQLSIMRSLSSQRDVTRADASATQLARIVVNFPTKGKPGALRWRTTYKRMRATTIDPSRVAMPPGTKLRPNKSWIEVSRDASNMVADLLR